MYTGLLLDLENLENDNTPGKYLNFVIFNKNEKPVKKCSVEIDWTG